WWTHLPDITAPTLLIGGGSTSHLPQEKFVDVARVVPRCTPINTPAGHDIHESEPDAFAEVVLNWLGAYG
ncbi:MAG: alpha/beta fold hydrolase, partial [Nocardioidaceae bacterium]